MDLVLKLSAGVAWLQELQIERANQWQGCVAGCSSLNQVEWVATGLASRPHSEPFPALTLCRKYCAICKGKRAASDERYLLVRSSEARIGEPAAGGHGTYLTWKSLRLKVFNAFRSKLFEIVMSARMKLSKSLLLSPLFIALCHALPTLAAENSTDPPKASDKLVGWQANAARRGTLDIIWSCIFTILACTWSIQHLNVPSKEDLRCYQWRWRIIGLLMYPLEPWKVTRRKLKWTVYTILFPELILAHAVVEFRMALDSMWWMTRRGRRMLVKYPKILDWLGYKSSTDDPKDNESPVPRHWQWTMRHSYYANMGGFRLYMIVSRETWSTGVREAVTRNFGVLQDERPDAPYSGDEKAIELCCLTAIQLVYCLENPKDFRFEDVWVSEEEIKDKGKMDLFTRFIACLQLGSLLVSVCVRWGRHQAVSQLEVLTVVFVICALLVYAFRWYKPQGVETPSKVWLEANVPGSTRSFAQRIKDHGRQLRDPDHSPDGIYKVLQQPDEGQIPPALSRVPNDNIPSKGWNNSHPVVYILVGFTVAVGLLHLMAWKFAFPSTVEWALWISCCFVLVVLPWVPVLIIPKFRKIKWRIRVFRFIHNFTGCLRKSVRSRQRRLMKFDKGNADVTLDDALDAWTVHDRFEEMTSEVLRQLGEFDAVTYRELLKYHDPLMRWYFEELKRRLSDMKELEKLETVMKGILELDYREQADLLTKFPTLDSGRRTSVIFWGSIFVYSTARIIMLAVAFSTLRAMPDSLYETTWVDVIPNVT